VVSGAHCQGFRLRRFSLALSLAALILWSTASPAFLFAQRAPATLGPPDVSRSEAALGARLAGIGQFRAAIRHLLAAREDSPESFAVNFNLALCYVGVGEYENAIPLLNRLREEHSAANVENLLAQAYIGSGQSDKALAAIQRAVARTPSDEKLYLYIADACMASADYALGVKTMDLGLMHLPGSARLHYQRGVFLTSLELRQEADQEFDAAVKLAGGGSIGYAAAARKNLFAGNIPEAVRIAREGAHKADADFLLLTFLGEALIRSGVAPGDPGFAEARSALQEAVNQRPSFSAALIGLAKRDLMEHRWDGAIERLQAARQLEPRNAAIYSNLVQAYRMSGDPARAQEALSILKQINQEQVARIRSAPGDRKAAYGQIAPR
jgi:tetratricopeptide (TPR) repeat protein